MKVIMSTNNLEVIRFEVNLKEKKVFNVEVTNQMMARVYLPQYKNLTYDNFHDVIKRYMGGEYELDKYIEHIEANGFYTPYKPNLCIEIER